MKSPAVCAEQKTLLQVLYLFKKLSALTNGALVKDHIIRRRESGVAGLQIRTRLSEGTPT